jgi:hypothetical protein
MMPLPTLYRAAIERPSGCGALSAAHSCDRVPKGSAEAAKRFGKPAGGEETKPLALKTSAQIGAAIQPDGNLCRHVG